MSTSARIAFIASDSPEAQASSDELKALYGNIAPDDADVIVALGGDGFMQQTLHKSIHRPLPIFGMNRGTVGFLMNQFSTANLPDRLAQLIALPCIPCVCAPLGQKGM